MRVLLTNNTLANRAGSELYVRDLAVALRERGHQPVAFGGALGDVADDLRTAGIPVVDDLDVLVDPPDVVHGQHHLEVMTALLHFADVPAVFFRHGVVPWEEHAPVFPRILRYVTTGPGTREMLAQERGIPLDRIEVIPNFVDLRRFRPRGLLPPRPARALILSNQADDSTHVPAVREACARAGVALDVLGLASGRPVARPQDCLPAYDLVFAIGRSALEAMAVGAAVILCDAGGLGPMVTSADLDDLRAANLGARTLTGPLLPEAVFEQIERYDPRDAAAVSRCVRLTAGLDEAAERIIGLYERVIAEYRSASPPSSEDESRAASAYLRWLAPRLKTVTLLAAERDDLLSLVERLRAQLAENTTWAQRAADDVAQRDATICQLRRELDDQTAWAVRSAEEVHERDAIVQDLQAQLGRAPPHSLAYLASWLLSRPRLVWAAALQARARARRPTPR